MKEEKCWKMQDWIRMSLIFEKNNYKDMGEQKTEGDVFERFQLFYNLTRRVQLMKSNIEMKMELMERRQCVILQESLIMSRGKEVKTNKRKNGNEQT